jgi:lipooligosaccharide transport system permease protein
VSAAAAVALRVANGMVPGGGGRRAVRLVERNLLSFRKSRGWVVILSGFYESLLYLLGIGIGVGALVQSVQQDGVSYRYAVFVAPAMMASSAMNGAVNESVYNVYYKLRYAKLYDAVLATPLTMLDVALGEVGWALMRSAAYATGFLVVMAALGLVISPWAVLALPAALLISVAFAGTGIAVVTYVRSWNDIAGVQMVVLPLFLLSATFYPLSTYPAPAQVLVELTPLYHGVHMLRALCTGHVDATVLLDVAYLLAMGSFGVVLAARRLARVLLR